MSNAFIQTVEGDIVTVGRTAWNYVEGKLLGYGLDELVIITNVVAKAIEEAEKGATIEQIVTACLNLLSQSESAELGKIESDFLASLVALGLVQS